MTCLVQKIDGTPTSTVNRDLYIFTESSSRQLSYSIDRILFIFGFFFTTSRRLFILLSPNLCADQSGGSITHARKPGLFVITKPMDWTRNGYSRVQSTTFFILPLILILQLQQVHRGVYAVENGKQKHV